MDCAQSLCARWLCRFIVVVVFQPVRVKSQVQKALEIFRSQIPERLYCWINGRRRDLCCGANAELAACTFDQHVFTYRECCATNYSIVDPYKFTQPAVNWKRFPAVDSSWSGERHPSSRSDQRLWETLMRFVTTVTKVSIPLSSTTREEFEIVVYKGDRTEVPIDFYGFTSWASELRGRVPERIIDVGGNYGGTSIALARIFPSARIIALEPNPLLCRFLTLNVRLHGLTHRIWPLCAGLGRSDSTLSMITCIEPWFGGTVNSCINLGLSTFESKDANRKTIDVAVEAGRLIEVPVISMPNLLKAFHWDALSKKPPLDNGWNDFDVDVLKIDCEGCEWDTLLSERSWTVGHVAGEVHFKCGVESCWPPRAADLNCSIAMFSSALELSELLEKCVEELPRNSSFCEVLFNVVQTHGYEKCCALIRRFFAAQVDLSFTSAQRALIVMPPKRKPAPALVSGTACTTPPLTNTQVEQVADKLPVAEYEIPAAVFEQLASLTDRSDLVSLADSTIGCGSSPEQMLTAKPISKEDYVTVVVTPKLTFQLLKRPEWHTVEDITQAELRRGFLSRFPPALWLSSEKFSFKPALAPTSKLTEDMKTIFFKIVSDEVPDERVMLGIIRELEKSYEAIIRRAVSETRSEALQEQFTLQEQAEEERREQAKHIKELRREVKSLREQMQPIQKRLFLIEQEKDQLQREQHQAKDYISRLERQQAEKDKQSKLEQEDIRSQLASLRTLVEGVVAGAVVEPSTRSSNITESSKLDKAKSNSRREVAVQTQREPREETEDTEISRRMDTMQRQFGALQAWMIQGSQLLNSMPAQQVSAQDQQKVSA